MLVRDRGILKRKSSGVSKKNQPYAMADIATMGRTVNVSVTMEQFTGLPAEGSEVEFTAEEDIGFDQRPRYVLKEMKLIKAAAA